MQVLFVHQNFPGQYRHLAPALAARGHQVTGLGETVNVKQTRPQWPGVGIFGYTLKPPGEKTGDPVTDLVLPHLRRGQAVAQGLVQLRDKGLKPDLICAQIGWGEAIFTKDVFPDAKLLLYCEFYYHARGADSNFDPEFPSRSNAAFRVHLMNLPLTAALEVADAGHAPTEWQRSKFPEHHRNRITAVHEGIDTTRAAPAPDTVCTLPDGRELRASDRIITYLTRNFEPYRGFHVFMRAIPEIQRRCPDAKIVMVGGDRVSYSPRLPPGESYRDRLTKEMGSKIDWSRIILLPPLPYSVYLSLLRISSVHVYLTYPFVLSWSLLEAMSSGCAIVASRTPPVEEVMRHGEHGLLVDFFSGKELAASIEQLYRNRDLAASLGARARQSVVEKYDLQTKCLPKLIELVEGFKP
jgi:glycosyltransferase involved in cell wall biosynthesis